MTNMELILVIASFVSLKASCYVIVFRLIKERKRKKKILYDTQTYSYIHIMNSAICTVLACKRLKASQTPEQMDEITESYNKDMKKLDDDLERKAPWLKNT